MVVTRTGQHPSSSIMVNSDTQSQATAIPMTSLPNVHSVTPRAVIKQFDGTKPEELDAIIRECETVVLTQNPHFNTPEQMKLTPFSNACLHQAVFRLNLHIPDVNSAYQIWKSSPDPTWTTLCEELKRYFISPFIKAPQAANALLSQKPTGTDRQSLLNHISQMNEPYKAMIDLLQADTDMADVFDFSKIHKLRNFLFLQSLLSAAPKEYHCAILDKVSIKESPSLTCTKMAEAITQIVGRKSHATMASAWTIDDPILDQPPISSTYTPTPMTAAPVQYSRPANPTTYGGASSNYNGRATGGPTSSWTRPSSAMNPKSTSSTPGHSSTKSYWLPSPGLCTNCNKPGHKYPACPYEKFCWFHMQEGHPWITCREFPDQVNAAKQLLGWGKSLGFRR